MSGSSYAHIMFEIFSLARGSPETGPLSVLCKVWPLAFCSSKKSVLKNFLIPYLLSKAIRKALVTRRSAENGLSAF